MVSINEAFAKRIIGVHGQKGEKWLASLDNLIGFCEKHWRCKISEPFELSYNYVAPITFENGGEAVLKLCVPSADCLDEIHTLKHYNGGALCHLVDSIDEQGILIVERLKPGNNLKSANEKDAVKVAAPLIRWMKSLRLQNHYSFSTVSDNAFDLVKLRKHFEGRTSPFHGNVVAKVEGIFPQLAASQKDTYLLHGDVHHANILSTNNSWKLIDPKGLMGEMEYEIFPFLINNLPAASFEEVIERRIQLFEDELQIDIERTYAWSLYRSLLSAWWSIEDNMGISDTDLRIIDLFNKKVSRPF